VVIHRLKPALNRSGLCPQAVMHNLWTSIDEDAFANRFAALPEGRYAVLSRVATRRIRLVRSMAPHC
jgi:hypothetical protein